MVRRAIFVVAADDQDFFRSPTHKGADTMNNGYAIPLITSVCYVRLAVSELHGSARFVSDIFGLQRVADQDGEIAFRSDDRYRTVSLGKNSIDGAGVGVEVWNDRALAEISTRLRDPGIVQFHGVGLCATDHARDVAFWKALGAEVSDWVGDIAYLRIDGKHHRIALYPSQRNGLLYAAFEVESLDQIMQNSYFMQENQVKIIQGPGRQAASGQIFLHVEGPDGLILSYVTGIAEVSDKPRPPRQFPLTATSLCNWGSESKGVPELSAQDEPNRRNA